MKSRLQLAGLGAALATAAGLQAEVKINENLSLDGYAVGAFAVTEPSAGQNDTFLDSGSRLFDSAKIAVNGKYGDFSGKVSFHGVPNNKSSIANGGLLDAYATYTTGSVAITGGKFNSYLGYESFDSPSNAFIDYGLSGYTANYATGAKIDYTGDGIAFGASVRDSLLADADGYLQGDGEFSDDLGYEAYALFTGVEKLTVFVGAGYEDTDGIAVDALVTYNAWASYAVTDKLSVVGEYAVTEDANNGSWLGLATYAVSESVSVGARLTGLDGDNNGADSFGYGAVTTYTFSPNFAVRGQITKTDADNNAADVFAYAVQGVFKF